MVFLSPDFAKLRFRKTLRQKAGSFSLNGILYRLFFAVEENRPVAQIAAELGIPLADARQGLERLCAQGMIAPLADQGPYLPDSTMAQIQHQFGLAMGGQAQASGEMLRVVRQLSEDGRHVNLTQARTFLNRLCDRIQQAEARQRFRARVVALLRERTASPTDSQDASPPRSGTVSRGRTHAIISAITQVRSQGNPRHVPRIEDAFRRHGIDPNRYRADTRDDPHIVARLERMAGKAGIALPQPGGDHSSAHLRSTKELRRLLDAIITERHGDSPKLARNLRDQLRFKGIHPGMDDDDADGFVSAGTLNLIHRLAGDLGVDTEPPEGEPGPPASRGRTKRVLDRILQPRTAGAPRQIMALRTKLLLRGIDPDAYTAQTPDDPAVLRQVEAIAARLGLTP